MNSNSNQLICIELGWAGPSHTCFGLSLIVYSRNTLLFRHDWRSRVTILGWSSLSFIPAFTIPIYSNLHFSPFFMNYRICFRSTPECIPHRNKTWRATSCPHLHISHYVIVIILNISSSRVEVEVVIWDVWMSIWPRLYFLNFFE